MFRKLFFILLVAVFLSPVCTLAVEDPSARAQKTFVIPGDYQVQIEWSGANPIYVGYADRGLATSAEGWYILKITWSGSTPTAVKSVHNAVWDNRATYTYQ